MDERYSAEKGEQATSQKIKSGAGDAIEKAAEVARKVGGKAREAAAETSSSITEQVKGLLDDQVGQGADIASHFASSMRLAADDLENSSPMVAGLVRTFSNKVDTYADDLQGQTVGQLVTSASEFTRRQPALVFGLAAFAGFFALRSVKNSSDSRSPSLQPKQDNDLGDPHG